MTCPHCGAAMHPDHDDRRYCTACGLAGPRDVLEALAARLARAEAAVASVVGLLMGHGCDCDCQHHWSEHGSECAHLRCFPCRLAAVVQPAHDALKEAGDG
jgi:hypothetical protein